MPLSVQAARRTKKKRAARANSNVFARFDQDQIAEFQEAFHVIDTNSDGFITRDDLQEIMTSLSPKEPTEAEISEMMAAAPDGIEKINWIMFLTMFAEKMEGTDPEEVIRNAFKCFDSEDKGVMGEEQLKEILTTMGDKKMTPEEVDLMLESAPYDKDGNFDYLQFTKTLKHGTVVKS
eukprot:m.432560 g.432560  ORF g.432560 m.432560 type:complete len:178 (+) comp17453_c0_seq1:172-705(+)